MSLVELGRYPDAALAHILKGRLESAGIHAVCFDTGMNVVEGIPNVFGVRLMVLAEDFAEARKVLSEHAADAQDIFGEDPFAGEEFDDAAWASDNESSGVAERRSRLLMWGAILIAATFVLPLVAGLLD
jgi:hypothetical protein